MRGAASGQEGADDDAFAGAGVEVDEDDLLVFAGHEFAVGEGEGEAGAEEGGAEVAVAVVVVPSLLVLVGGVVGDEFLHEGGEVVLDETGLEFQGGEGGGGSDDEEVEDAVAAEGA